ncbi:MAG: prepilin-type N-terminal cleavage/methylation domain-containing protein [Cyanobacteriota bacterium]|nr:prepilin-type N-terminal cleavage/methylation domain-containing protein [Cyanobacteriota bacterium]
MKGFTMMELLTVTIIVGVLTAVAIPTFINLSRRSKVAEVQTALTAVSRGSEVYRLRYTTYPSAYADIEWSPTNKHYMNDPWSAANYNEPVVQTLTISGIHWSSEAINYVNSNGDLLRCDVGLGDQTSIVESSIYSFRNSCNVY